MILIDKIWLSTRTAPYLLPDAGQTYRLDADIDVPGTAFVVGGQNITLDLNGHTVTYGDVAPITLINGGFEDGLNGWDTSLAPGAVLAPSRIGFWGAAMLSLPPFTTPQTFVSAPIQIPVPNHEYVATITPKGTSGVGVSISVIDTVTGQVLGSGVSSDAARGFGAVATFFPITTNPVVIKVTASLSWGTSGACDFDYAAVFASRDYGVLLSPSSWYFPKHLQTQAILAAVAKGTNNFTLQGGNLIQGKGRVFQGNAVHALSARFPSIFGVNLFVNGMDTSQVCATYTTSLKVVGCTLMAGTDNMTNRMADIASISVASVSGDIVIDGNTINSSPEQAIIVSGMSSGTLKITNNKISQNAIVTEGYGIVLVGVINFEIAGNVVNPVIGRGLLIDGWNSLVTQNGSIHDNQFYAVENANLEYVSAGLDATALRMRNYNGAHRNIEIYKNTFSASAGSTPKSDRAAIAARISETNNSAGVMLSGNINIHDNLFSAVANSKAVRAFALSLSGVDKGSGLSFSNNVFSSNDVSVNLGDSDSYAAINQDVTFTGNVIGKILDPNFTHTSIAVGDWRNVVTNIRFVNTQFVGGAGNVPVFLYESPKDITLSASVDLSLTGVSSLPVQVVDQSGAVQFTGQTDASGKLAAIPFGSTKYQQLTSDPTKITVTTVPGGKLIVG